MKCAIMWSAAIMACHFSVMGAEWSPAHVHALTTYGAFNPDGTFIPLPDDLSSTPFRKLWETKILRLVFQ